MGHGRREACARTEAFRAEVKLAVAGEDQHVCARARVQHLAFDLAASRVGLRGPGEPGQCRLEQRMGLLVCDRTQRRALRRRGMTP